MDTPVEGMLSPSERDIFQGFSYGLVLVYYHNSAQTMFLVAPSVIDLLNKRNAAAFLSRSPRRPKEPGFGDDLDEFVDAAGELTLTVPAAARKAPASSKLAFEPMPLDTHAVLHNKSEHKASRPAEDDAPDKKEEILPHQHLGFV